MVMASAMCAAANLMVECLNAVNAHGQLLLQEYWDMMVRRSHSWVANSAIQAFGRRMARPLTMVVLELPAIRQCADVTGCVV